VVDLAVALLPIQVIRVMVMFQQLRHHKAMMVGLVLVVVVMQVAVVVLVQPVLHHQLHQLVVDLVA
jgi:hypothetical protein|tara:strand:- start:261 stop:458 length:198 start_codon:yes stop_codon:yes gene_type:complete